MGPAQPALGRGLVDFFDLPTHGGLGRRGRLSLLVGSAFLAGCLLLGQVVATLGSNAAADLVREGLTIGGWVAMWRPLEIYLYDWWPLFEERRRFDLLAQLTSSRSAMKPLWPGFPSDQAACAAGSSDGFAVRRPR